MSWNRERFAALPAAIPPLCFAILVAGGSVAVLQGCSQSDDGTDTAAEETVEPTTSQKSDSTAEPTTDEQVGTTADEKSNSTADPTANEKSGQRSIQDRLFGCWKLRLTAEGAKRDSLRSRLPSGSLPSIIELDTTRVESAEGDSVYKAHAHGLRPGLTSPFSVWRPSGDDSIRVERPGAMAGTTLQLKPTGDKLVGNVVVFTDAGGMNQSIEDLRRRGSVEAVPVECPGK